MGASGLSKTASAGAAQFTNLTPFKARQAIPKPTILNWKGYFSQSVQWLHTSSAYRLPRFIIAGTQRRAILKNSRNLATATCFLQPKFPIFKKCWNKSFREAQTKVPGAQILGTQVPGMQNNGARQVTNLIFSLGPEKKLSFAWAGDSGSIVIETYELKMRLQQPRAHSTK